MGREFKEARIFFSSWLTFKRLKFKSDNKEEGESLKKKAHRIQKHQNVFSFKRNIFNDMLMLWPSPDVVLGEKLANRCTKHRPTLLTQLWAFATFYFSAEKISSKGYTTRKSLRTTDSTLRSSGFHVDYMHLLNVWCFPFSLSIRTMVSLRAAGSTPGRETDSMNCPSLIKLG